MWNDKEKDNLSQFEIASVLKRIGIIMLIVFLAGVLRVVMIPGIDEHVIWITFYPAVMLAALYGGFAGGMLGVICSYFAAMFISQNFLGWQFFTVHNDLLSTGVFFGTCILISIVAELKMRSAKKEKSAKEQVAEALKESEEYYRAIFDNAENGLSRCQVIFDENKQPVDYIFIDVNDSYESYIGLKKENIFGKRVTEINPDLDKSIIQLHCQVAITGKEYNYEQFNANHKRWYQVNVYCPKLGYFISTFSDITEQKQAEEALRQSEQKLRLHFENSPLAVVEWDKNLIVTSWSNEADKIFGWTNNEVIGNRIDTINLIYDADIPKVNLIIERLMSGKESSVTSSNRNYTKTGEIIECVWHNSILKDENGEMMSVMSLVQDITEKKSEEEALRKSEENLRDAQRIAKIGNWELEINISRLVWSDMIFEIFEIDREKFGASYDAFLNAIHPEDREMVNTAYVESLEHKKQYEISHRLLMSDGRIKWVNEICRTEFGRDGQAIRSIGIVQDITAIKEAEIALNESEQQLAITLSSIGDAVIATDNSGLVSFLNPVAEELTGWTLKEATGKPEKEIFNIINEHTRKEVESPIMKVLEFGKIVTLANHTILIRKDGSEVPIDDSGAPIKDADGKISGAVLVFRDITERKQAEEISRRQNELLEGINKILNAGLVCKNKEELGKVCLEVAERITQSKFGFIGEINDQGLEDIAISNPGWDACNIIDSEGHNRPAGSFKILGIYGRVLSDGVSLLTNSPENHPDSIGIPDGHPPLHTFLGTPLIREGKTIGMIAVGNKESGFTQRDQEFLEALAPAIVEAFLRKKAEEDLRQSEERFRLALMNSAINISSQDLDLRYTWIYNPQLHLSADNVLGKTDAELFPLQTYQHVSELKKRAIETGEQVRDEVSTEYLGMTNYYDFTVEPIIDGNGHIAGVYNVVIDITDRKLLEEALRENEEKFRLMANAIPQLAWMADADGYLYWYNDRWYEYTGTTPAEMEGWGWQSVHDLEVLPKVLVEWQKSLSTGEPFDMVFPMLGKDGSFRPFLTRVMPLKDSNGKVLQWFGTNTDVSEQKQKEEELNRLNRTLKALSKSDQALVRTSSEQEFLDEACRIIVEDCGHKMVWIGYADDDENKSVRPVAWSGFEEGYLETLQITWADTERGQGPTGTAIRTGKPASCRNMLTDEKFLLWREEAFKRGYASSLVLPMKSGDKVIGALSIYSREADPFSDLEIEFLAELAQDLTFGIISFRLREAKAQVEKALGQSELRYRLLFEQMSEGFALHEVVCDENNVPIDYRFLEINPAFERLTGLNREVVLGRLKSEALPEDDSFWVDTYGQVALTGIAIHFEQYAEPLKKYYEIFAYSPVIGQFAVMFVDITERKKTQTIMERYQLISQYARDPLLLIDVSGKIVEGNHAALELYGYTREEFINLTIKELRDPEEAGLIEKQMNIALKRGILFETTHRRKDGSLIPIEVSARGVQIEGKEMLLSVVRDITERKQQEIMIRESEEKYRRLVEGSPNIIYSFSDKRGGIYYSKHIEKVLGYNVSYLLDNPMVWRNSIHPDDIPAVEFALASAQKENNFELEYRIRDINNNWRWFYDRFIGMVSSENETIIEGIAVDITKLKETEQKLREVNASKDKFFSILAHDLRSPFSGFIGLTEILNQEIGVTPIEDLKDIAKSIHESANSIYTLLTDLLQWAKTQMGNMPVNKEELDLNELVFEGVYRSRKEAERKRITVNSEVKPGLIIECDRNMISSVIRNLVNNSIKFTREGGTVKISSKSTDGHVEIIVNDNGVGIVKDRVDKLFQIGDSYSTIGTANEKGTGLGLILTKEFVEKHGGTINVESEFGVGSTFSVILPKTNGNSGLA